MDTVDTNPIENPIASITFNALSDAAREALYPRARGEAVARTLIELGALCPESPLSAADAAAGFEILAMQKREEEPAAVTLRRLTCLELARILRAKAPNGGAPIRLAWCFSCIADQLREATDARLAAIAETAHRESREIREFDGTAMQGTTA